MSQAKYHFNAEAIFLELGEAGRTHIFNLDIINGEPATVISQLQVIHFGLVCSFCGCVYATIKQHARSQRL